MLFKPNHIDLIKEGIKTQTRRRWESSHVYIGHYYSIMRDYRHKHNPDDGYILIKKLWQQRLGDMTEQEAQAEEGYFLLEYKQIWKGINGSWNDDDIVWVVDFEFRKEKVL